MKLNIVTKREAPPEPWRGELTCTIVDSLPFTLSALRLRAEKYWWASDDDWYEGRSMLNNQGANMLLGCCDEITKRQDQLYRLFDNVYNGTSYTSSEDRDTGEITIEPAIPVYPALSDPMAGSMRYLTRDTRLVVGNALLGETSLAYPDPRNIRDQLADILTAIQSIDTSDDDILEKLDVLLLLIGG